MLSFTTNIIFTCIYYTYKRCENTISKIIQYILYTREVICYITLISESQRRNKKSFYGT